MSTNASLADKAGVVVFARLVTTIMDITLAIVLVRLLTKGDFVVISFLLLVYETAKYLATLGFPDSVFYFFERIGTNARAGFALQTAGILVGTALVAGLVMVGLVPWLPALLSEWAPDNVAMVGSLLPVMALVAILEIPTWPVNNLMLAADRARSASWYSLMNSALTFAAIIGPIALGYGLPVAIWCLLAYSVIRLLVSIVWMWRILPRFETMPPRGMVRQQVGFAIPIGLSALVARINRNADKFIVSFFLPESIVAIYLIGATEIPLVKVIPFAVGSVLISRFVQFQMDDKRDELRELWYKGIEKVSLIVLPLTFVFITFAPEWMVLLFGEKMEAAAVPFRIYSLIILLRVTSYGSILQAFGDTKSVLRLSLSLLGLNVLFSVPATLYFGIIGTASAAVVANYVNLGFTLRMIGRHMGLPWHQVLPLKAYVRILALAVGSAAIVFALKSVLMTEAGPRVILLTYVPVYGAAFLLIGRRTGIVSDSDWGQLKSWLKLRFLFSGR